jgi:hypothetical protein
MICIIVNAPPWASTKAPDKGKTKEEAVNVSSLKVALFGSLLVAAISTYADAQTPPGAVPSGTTRRAQEQSQMAVDGTQMIISTSVNPITQTAVSLGVLSCASRVNQVTNFLGGSSQETGAFIFAPPAEADQSLFSVSMEVPGGQAATAYASATFAPNQANGCGALYETVAYWPLSCDQVAQKHFSGMKRLREVKQNITVLSGNSPARVFLLPAGAGCVTVKKEIVR